MDAPSDLGGDPDDMLMDSGGDVSIAATPEIASVQSSGKPLISTEEAARKLGSEVLAALEKNFNGSLTDIRYPDENDRIF